MGALASAFSPLGTPPARSAPREEGGFLAPRETRDALLAATKFPTSVIAKIMRFSGADVVLEQKARSHAIGGLENADHEYLSLPLASGVVMDERLLRQFALEEIVVRVTSHDQGWSSYPDDHGTKNGSWTWVEAGITTPASPRVMIAVNIHADSAWQDHVYKSSQDENPSLLLYARAALANVGGATTTSTGANASGPFISIYARSQYPGWAIFLQKASVELRWRWLKAGDP